MKLKWSTYKLRINITFFKWHTTYSSIHPVPLYIQTNRDFPIFQKIPGPPCLLPSYSSLEPAKENVRKKKTVHLQNGTCASYLLWRNQNNHFVVESYKMRSTTNQCQIACRCTCGLVFSIIMASGHYNPLPSFLHCDVHDISLSGRRERHSSSPGRSPLPSE